MLHTIYSWVFFWLVLGAGVVSSAEAPVSPRLPVNGRCPHHGYPYSDRAYAEYVANHPLMQPGISEQMATSDPEWFSQQLTEFVFASAQFAANYLDKVPPINSQRPFEFKLDCGSDKYKGILSGKKRDTNATIIWSSRFAYETPLLLYRLHTFKDLVDFFLISETVRVDQSHTPKPLMFERVKHHFVEFLPQIVHQVIDDVSYGKPFDWSSTTATVGKDVWTNEGHHFRHIAKATLSHFKDYPDDSIVLHGDFDETPDEDFLFHLRQCDLDPHVRFPIRSNAVMWLYDYRYIFKGSSDDPNPFTFRFPLFYTLGYLRKPDAATINLRHSPANSPKPSLPGGWHFNYMLFPPTVYLKLGGTAIKDLLTIFGARIDYAGRKVPQDERWGEGRLGAKLRKIWLHARLQAA